MQICRHQKHKYFIAIQMINIFPDKFVAKRNYFKGMNRFPESIVLQMGEGIIP